MVMQVSDAGSVEKWWVTKAVTQNGTAWNYYDPDLNKWGGNWIPEGYVEAGAGGQPLASQDRVAAESRAQGKADAAGGTAFADAFSSGPLNLALGLTTGGVGGQVIDILSSGAEQLTANGGKWEKVDLVDMLAAGTPAFIDIPLSATFDFTLERATEGDRAGQRGTFSSVFGGKSLIDAAIEGGWSLGGQMVPVGDVARGSGRRVAGYTTGVAEEMGSTLVKDAAGK